MDQAVNAPVTAFLPCRKGSERVPRKNIRPFGSVRHGLIEIKLRQLQECAAIDHVVLSTNDDEIIEYAQSVDGPGLTIHRRAEHLSSSATSTDDLVGHARELVGSGHILWTHVTSPFLTADRYDEIIASYRNALTEGYDSLMTTTLLRAFLWTEDGPLTYDRSVEKWPRTQTITPVHEVNSGVFLAPVEVYSRHQDRIGETPRLYPLDRLTAFDIDWEEDFVIAEQLMLKHLVSA
ncbi:acylneuraminate cytidylyltransferase family protein [Roseovarius sp. A21]|uniref:Acylneuraminate cytidylyltransferase family protein n=1 Tax=Roseovarius bejariae TaxID=2576383 RepID=A0A844D360_9RHOB|nr:acylneuraminate cytidylyltransferase family protein [Roseovarius bejariae]MRU15678.1 acylneuraminate cytidylyltransferase family protein [Roseovarius bejariae]